MVSHSTSSQCAAIPVFKCRSSLIFSVVRCQFPHPGPSQVLQVADALCARLSSRDLLGSGGDDEALESREKLLTPSSGCQSSSVNPLLISCQLSFSTGTYPLVYPVYLWIVCTHVRFPQCIPDYETDSVYLKINFIDLIRSLCALFF